MLEDGFESGDTSLWTSETENNGVFNVGTTTVHTGTYSGNSTVTQTAAWEDAFVHKQLAARELTVFTKTDLYLDSYTANNEIRRLIELSSGVEVAGIGISTGRALSLRYRNDSAISTDTSATTINLDQWYSLEIKGYVNDTQGEVRVYLDDVEINDITQTGLNNTSGDPEGILFVRVGISDAYDDDVMAHFDDIVIDTSYIGPMGAATYLTLSAWNPRWGLYNTSTVPVNLTADTDGVVDTIWYNLKNDSVYVYPTNLTYTVPTTMTGLTTGRYYEFLAWFNDTDGNQTGIAINFDVDLGSFDAPNGTWQGIREAVNAAEAAGGGNVTIPVGQWNYTEDNDVGNWQTIQVDEPIDIHGAPTRRNLTTGMVIDWGTSRVTSLHIPVNVSSGWGTFVTMFNFQGNQTYGNRITNIEFVGYRNYNTSSPLAYRSIYMDNQYDFRIDHIKSLNMGQGVKLMSDANGVIRGLIDHVNFTNTHGQVDWPIDNCTVFYGIDFNWGDGGSTFWDNNTQNVLGQNSNHTVFVEDSYFSRWRHCIASSYGASWVVRYTTIKYDSGMGSTDIHDTGRSAELYFVTMSDCIDNFEKPDGSTPGGQGQAHYQRGGALRAYNNTVLDDYKDGIVVANTLGNPPKKYAMDLWSYNNTFDVGVNWWYLEADTENLTWRQDFWNDTDGIDMPGIESYIYPHPLQSERPNFSPHWNISGGVTEYPEHYGDGAPTHDFTIEVERGHNTSIAGAACLLSNEWSDKEGALSHYYVRHNNTGSWQSTDVTPFAGASGWQWASITFTLNSTDGNVVAYQTYANDSSGVFVHTPYQYITITGGGWTGIVNGVTNPNGVMGVNQSMITKVNDVS